MLSPLEIRYHDSDLVVGGEVDHFNGLVGITAPIVATLPAETGLDALVERCLVIDDAVNTQRLEQIHAGVKAVDGHVRHSLQRLAAEVGLIGGLQVTGAEALGVEEAGEHPGVYVLQFGLVVLEVKHILGEGYQRQVAVETLFLDLFQGLDVFLD